MKKKICWFTANYFLDVDRQLVPYLREHCACDIQWTVVQTKNGASVPVHKDYDLLKLHYGGKDPRTLFEVNRYLDTLSLSNFNLIYSDSLGIMYYTALMNKAKHIPIVHAAHNVMPYPVWGWGLRLEVKYIFTRCRYFQLFSKHTAIWFSKHWSMKSFFYAPMTVKDFGGVQTNRYSIDESKVNLLFFGNIVANKRLDLLIEAIKHLPKNIQERVCLNICGNCRMDKEAFVRQIGDCKAINTYFKRIPDEEIPELFTKHQFLVLPYQDVAQSGPHMIAYNYNLPVIASDNDGFTERIEDNRNGFLFHVNDEQALIKVIVKAVEQSKDEYRQMKTELQQFVDENYRLNVVSEKYLDYFNRILS